MNNKIVTTNMESENYVFLLGKKGEIFYKKTNFLFSALIKLNKEELHKFPLLKEDISLNLKKKIPFLEVQKVIKFFKKIKSIYNKEALAILLFHPEKEEFKILIPHQNATCVGVDSDEKIIEQDGFKPIGSIHSHPREPFHSPGDIEDEAGFDGIHLTCGNLHKEKPDWCASLVVHGRRIKLDPKEIMELDIECPTEWLRKIMKGERVRRMFSL